MNNEKTTFYKMVCTAKQQAPSQVGFQNPSFYCRVFDSNRYGHRKNGNGPKIVSSGILLLFRTHS